MNCTSGICGIRPLPTYRSPYHCRPLPKRPCAPIVAGQVNVIDNLVSTRTDDALSANMGRVLREMIEANYAELIEQIEELDQRITDEIAIVNNRITQEISNINQQITEINNNITNLTGNYDAEIIRLDGRIDLVNNAVTLLRTDMNSALDTKVDKITGLGLSQESFTTEEKEKLASLESSHFRGEFVSLTALQTEVPVGNAGDFAYVDAGAGSNSVMYIWSTSDNEWQLAQSTPTDETPESIKEKYESNADTNAYTDIEKSKLVGIASGAEVNQNAFSNVSNGSTTAQATTKTDTLTVNGGGYTTTVITGKTLTLNTEIPEVTISTPGLMASLDKLKLNNATSFGSVYVTGGRQFYASGLNDILTLTAGNNITLETDTTAKNITINSTASGSGGADVITGSVSVLSTNWTSDATSDYADITIQGVTTGDGFINIWPSVESQDILDAAMPYAHVYATTTNVVRLRVKIAPSVTVNLNYSIIS